MTKEFYKRNKKWNYEGWVSLSFQEFGFGFITYNKKGSHNLEVGLPFFNFYISFYKSKS